MPARDPRVDAYIARSADFARPILTHIRDVVHAACPEVEETIKWGMPFFTYDGPLCSMAAFKTHCAFGFWKHALVFDGAERGDAMGSFGRLTSVDDLPPKREIVARVKKAVKLNEGGAKAPTPPKRAAAKKVSVVVPAYFTAALKKNAKARATFESLSPSHRREYVEWVDEAKREETRARRLATALEWLAEGKRRNWKYE